MPEQRPIPIDYSSPPPGRRPPLTSIGLTIYLGFICLVFLIFGWFILPRFEVIFADFNTELPLVTVALLGFARWLRGFPGVLVLLAIPALVPMLLARFIHGGNSPQANRIRALVAYALVTFVAAALICWIILAVFVPWVRLIQSVATPGGGR